ncbi:MAG: Preprotein translocase SecG [Thermoanaerobacterales bacterium 50_218]|nr:MAG: Preprotein translocase SecG [Thermoanaerobacterales bacterium 50_218]
MLIALQVLISLGLIATILLQSGRSAGLSGAIAGGAQALLGKKKGIDDLLNRISTVLAVAFLVITLVVAML